MENPIAKFDSVQFPVNEAAMTDQVSLKLLFEVVLKYNTKAAFHS